MKLRPSKAKTEQAGYNANGSSLKPSHKANVLSEAALSEFLSYDNSS